MSDSATLWTIAHQAPLSTGFSRQEHWNALPFPSQNIYINICKIESGWEFTVTMQGAQI